MKTKPEKRNDLHIILCEILGSDHCYFSPPSNIKMRYPCIVYHQDGVQTIHADNKRYLNKKLYSITVIDKNPNSMIPERLLFDCRLQYLSEDSTFITDGLYHHQFTLYF